MVSEVCRGVQRGVPSTRQIFTFGGDFVNTQVLCLIIQHTPRYPSVRTFGGVLRRAKRLLIFKFTGTGLVND